MPYLESKAEVRVSKHVLVTDSGALIPWCIHVERVPVLDSGNFKELEECYAEYNQLIIQSGAFGFRR